MSHAVDFSGQEYREQVLILIIVFSPGRQADQVLEPILFLALSLMMKDLVLLLHSFVSKAKR